MRDFVKFSIDSHWTYAQSLLFGNILLNDLSTEYIHNIF